MKNKKLSLSAEYDSVQNTQCYNILRFLQDRQCVFSMICESKYVSFEPMLPKNIMDGFQSTLMFVIAGYALSSLRLGSRGMSFEAGFGQENIGACVQVDYANISQILVVNQQDKHITLFSRMNSKDIFGIEQDSYEDGLARSMEAILSHPHNQKFFP